MTTLRKTLEILEQNPGITVADLADFARANIHNVRKWMNRHEYNGIVTADRSEMTKRVSVVEGWREKLDAYEERVRVKAITSGKTHRQQQMQNPIINDLLQMAMAMRPDVKTTWRPIAFIQQQMGAQ